MQLGERESVHTSEQSGSVREEGKGEEQIGIQGREPDAWRVGSSTKIP